MPKNSQVSQSRLLERAIDIAAEAHRGQRDRNGMPYLLHPLRLMCRARGVDQQMVAVLHDVVEDSDWTLEDLRAEGFPKRVVRAVDHLTRRDTETYDEFVDRAMRDPLARAVKLLDLEDNMDPRRLHRFDRKAVERFRRYVKAWNRLVAEQG